MQIDRLFLRGFRNLAETTVELGPGVIRVVGRNGQGKTNLFEAAHLLAQGWSFRTRRAAEWLRTGEESLVIRAEGESQGDPRRTAIAVEGGGATRRVKIDGREGSGTGMLLGAWPMVAVGPGDIALVQGEPEGRRLWIDALISQYSEAGRDALLRYRRTLRQRNAYLKGMVREDEDLKQVLDETLIAEGAEVVRLRREWIERMAPGAIAACDRISGGNEQVEIGYRCSWGAGGEEPFRSALRSLRARERDFKTTLVGPHRDDLVLKLNGEDFRSRGSQGQQRTMALALKLAAAEDLERNFREAPILLLDDIFSELDAERRRAVGELVERSAQVLVAAPEPESIPFAASRTLWVEGGVVEERG